MPALDPSTTVVIKIEAKDCIIKWTCLGLWSDINAYLDEPLTLGMHSATTYYTDAVRLGLDPAECLAYKAAELEYYTLSKNTAEPVTAEWWIAYQDARATKANLWLKIQKTVLANFRDYTNSLSSHPPWGTYMTLAGMRVRVA
jgi:hypothetical protein